MKGSHNARIFLLDLQEATVHLFSKARDASHSHFTRESIKILLKNYTFGCSEAQFTHHQYLAFQFCSLRRELFTFVFIVIPDSLLF